MTQTQPNLAWWENVCSDLERDPANATLIIHEFREQDYALEACHSWISQACTSRAKFQLCLVLQYASMKNWSQLSTEMKSSLRESLWMLIQTASLDDQMPVFALNKIIQVYSLLWKRGWCEVGPNSQQQLMDQLKGLFSTGNNWDSWNTSNAAFLTGIKLMISLLEEFESRSTSEIGLPLEFHMNTHSAFEIKGLNDCFELAQICLSGFTEQLHNQGQSTGTVTGTDTNTNTEAFAFSTIPLITESIRLYIELLHWTFDSTASNSNTTPSLTSKENSTSKRDKQNSNTSLNLPRLWSTVLLTEGFLDTIVNIYNMLRPVCLQIHNQPDTAHGQVGFNSNPNANMTKSKKLTIVHSCLAEIRVLIQALSSISGPDFYQDNNERILLGNRIFQATTPLLTQAISDSSLQQQQDNNNNHLLNELRSQESVGFAGVILRLLNNYKLSLCINMPAFTGALTAVGQSTIIIGQSMANKAQIYTTAIMNYQPNADDDEFLLDSWQGDAVMNLLETLCLVLDDPLYTEMISPSTSTSLSATTEAIALHQLMSNMSTQVFSQIFECYMHTTLWESLASEETEEDEEEEGIHARAHDDFLAAICTLGRVGLGQSLDYVASTINSGLLKSQGILSNTQEFGSVEHRSTCALEILRVSTLFFTHLLAEDYRSDIMSQKGLDTPCIPHLILEEARYNPQETRTKVWNTFWQITQCLQMEITLLSNSENSMRNHPLVSSYLLQHILNFFNEFFSRYILPDCDLYSSKDSNCILFQPPDAGVEFLTNIENIFSSINLILIYLPLENDVIISASQLIITASKCRHDGWTQSLLSLQSTSSLFQTITNSSTSNPNQVCMLNLIGLSSMFSALTTLTIYCKNESCFMQLCCYLQSSMQKIQNCNSKEEILQIQNKELLNKTIASLRGMARSPSLYGMDKILRQLYDYCLPIITFCLQFYNDAEADDVIENVLSLLNDYSEYKLDALPQTSTLFLFRASLTALELLAKRIQTPLTAIALGSQIAIEEESSWRSRILLTSLELLNNLSSKDFSLEYEDNDNDTINAANALQNGNSSNNNDNNNSSNTVEKEVSQVLIFGICSLVPTMSDTLLRDYPQLCDRYFAFISYIFNSYHDEISEHMQQSGIDISIIFLNTLFDHLLWASGGIESSAARYAFLTIQCMATSQLTFMAKGNGQGQGKGQGHGINDGIGIGIGLDINNSNVIFEKALDRILEMLFFPKTVEYGIAWDRVDACGNALMILIAINSQRFLQVSNVIIQQLGKQHPEMQQSLIACLQKLTTARNVNMTAIDRNNRRLFCQNFREFCLEIRPLIDV
jgi:hypothetical protein